MRTPTKRNAVAKGTTPEQLASMIQPADIRAVYLPDDSALKTFRARLYDINKNNVNPALLFTRYHRPWLYVGRLE